jgi:hypothetical protein
MNCDYITVINKINVKNAYQLAGNERRDHQCNEMDNYRLDCD